MPDMTASIFEHIAAKRHHVIIFYELVDLFFGDFHVVTITQVKVKVKGKSVFILLFYLLSWHIKKVLANLGRLKAATQASHSARVPRNSSSLDHWW
jgi:hypothetical protein